MSKRLDDLSRNLASGMSRRRALQLFAGGIAAAVFGRSAIDAQAAGEGKLVSDFCKAICTPFFPGNGNRGLQGNFTFGNFTFGNSTFGNNVSYGDCMSSCHTCTTFNPCTGFEICIENAFGGPYCVSSTT